MKDMSVHFFVVFTAEMTNEPVENVHELVLTRVHIQFHDSVQQVHQVRREIAVER